MLEYCDLVEITEKPDDFIVKAMEHNIAIFKTNNHSKESFYSFMKGLAKFGDTLEYLEAFDKTPCKIFRERYSESYHYSYKNVYKLRFHAIDKTGLSHTYILGPDLESLFHPGQVQEIFYGSRDTQNEEYNCVVKMNVKTPEESIHVNLNLLRQDYLPLGLSDYKDNRYFQSKNNHDNQTYGPLIYKATDRSFYLPIIELLRQHVDLRNDAFIKAVCKYDLEDGNISFDIYISWHSFLRDHWKCWSGKISRLTFEIISLTLTDEGSESTK